MKNFVLGYATQCPRDASPFELPEWNACMVWVINFQQIPIISVSSHFFTVNLFKICQNLVGTEIISQFNDFFHILGYATQCPQDASPFELPE